MTDDDLKFRVEVLERKVDLFENYLKSVFEDKQDELQKINERLRYIDAFCQDPVTTRFTLPFKQERNALWKRRKELVDELKEFDLLVM